jgi:uncharacterized protein YndB with AHSA1/START domain
MMELEIRPAPIRKSLLVRADPERAFGVFVSRMHEWSPAVQSLLGSRRDIVIEPHAGGRWYEIADSGAEADWGRVLVWEPPHRLVLAWQLDAGFRYDPGLVTEVEARFEAEGAGQTRVEFEHRNLDRFGAHAAETAASLDSEGGWSGSFALYVGLFENEGQE